MKLLHLFTTSINPPMSNCKLKSQISLLFLLEEFNQNCLISKTSLLHLWQRPSMSKCLKRSSYLNWMSIQQGKECLKQKKYTLKAMWISTQSKWQIWMLKSTLNSKILTLLPTMRMKWFLSLNQTINQPNIPLLRNNNLKFKLISLMRTQIWIML